MSTFHEKSATLQGLVRFKEAGTPKQELLLVLKFCESTSWAPVALEV